MVDLVEWLTACLDEDERIAREAGSLAWSRPEDPGDPAAIRDSEQERVVCYEGWPSEGQTVHIAAHDPARVLREIDAKRKALDHYAELQRLAQGGVAIYRTAAGAVGVQIQIMALAYADRPGYQEAWRPEHLD